MASSSETEETSGSRAEQLLQRVRDGAKYGNITLIDVENVLSDERFTSNQGLLTTTREGKSTLLHLAAQTQGDTVLPLVCQAYKRSGLFPQTMATLNAGGLSPLHVAVQTCRFENAVLLFKESQEHCPQTLEPDQEAAGWTVLHSASLVADNVNMVRYLLSQEICRGFVLCRGGSPRRRTPSLPQDIARDTVNQAEFQLKLGEDQLERFCKQTKMSSHSRNMHSRTMVDPKKKVVEKAKDMYAQIEQVTLELKACEAERRVKELERSKALERQEALNKKLEDLLASSQWGEVESDYLLSDSEETRKMCVQYLVSMLESLTLPALSSNVLASLSLFLNLPEDDSCLLYTLTLLNGYCVSDGVSLMLTHQDLLPRLSSLLLSRSTLLQSATTSLLQSLADNEGFPTDKCLLECLHLLKHYSTSSEVRLTAGEVLGTLGVAGVAPDPGTWGTRHVALWMDSISELDRRDQYIEAFLKADISGLHLLELSVGEMGALGVQFVSHQRTLADKIDELRRMNARLVVGQKDIFLSYAHVNINFARRIKSVLTEAHYSVWIDEAGIRAGQNWRNEIADGIQGCGIFLFLLSKRSANSQYCHNEVAMAETYEKPVVTVRVEEVGEVDPGLMFIIGRRQWLDFTREEAFNSSSRDLVEVVTGYIGHGKATHTSQSDATEEAPAIQHVPDEPPKHIGNVEVGSVLGEELERLRVSMETGLENLSQRMNQLEKSLTSVTSRVAALETAM